jgi:transposase-like protein
MIERNKIKRCPICGSTNIEHKLGDHVSKLRGITHNAPQTVCHNCREIFLGPDSLEVIRLYDSQRKHKIENVTA